MKYSIILHRLLVNQEHVIAVVYRHPQGLVYLNAHPAKITRMIETEWGQRAKTELQALGMDWMILNPSIISLDSNPANLFRWGIMTDPYDVFMMTVFGAPKFLAARCDGEHAQEFWEKGRKPNPPKELQ